MQACKTPIMAAGAGADPASTVTEQPKPPQPEWSAPRVWDTEAKPSGSLRGRMTGENADPNSPATVLMDTLDESASGPSHGTIALSSGEPYSLDDRTVVYLHLPLELLCSKPGAGNLHLPGMTCSRFDGGRALGDCCHATHNPCRPPEQVLCPTPLSTCSTGLLPYLLS